MNNVYQWHGVNQSGQRVQDRQSAINRQTLCSELQSQGITVLRIRKKFQLPRIIAKTISAKQLAGLTYHLSILCQSNVDFINALHIIIREENNSAIAKLVETIKKNIEQGNTFAEALTHFPHYFDNIYCAFIEAGEQSGTLGKMLQHLSEYQENILALRAKIAKALFYPTSIAVAAALITAGLLIFVVPQFKTIFNSFGAQLPVFTQAVIHLSNILKCNIKVILFFAASLFISYTYAIRHFNFIGICRDYLLMRLPVSRQLLTIAFFSQWAKLLATLLKAGFPLVNALIIADKSITNRFIRAAMHNVTQQVIAGKTFHEALSTHSLFPLRIVQMVAVGENTGQLIVMLQKIAEMQQNSLDRAIDYFSKWLEPAVMIILAIITGGLIIAMYLPVFKLGATL